MPRLQACGTRLRQTAPHRLRSLAGGAAATLDTQDLLAHYDMQQGADPDVVYDLTGNYHGQRGLSGDFKPAWSASGLVFSSNPHIVSLPTALAAQIRTDYWCLSYALNSRLQAFTTNWLTTSDGRFDMDGAPGNEAYSPVEWQVGNLIFAQTYGVGCKLYFGASNGTVHEVAGYNIRNESLFPQKDLGYDLYLMGFRSPCQYLGTWYYRLCYSVQHNAAQVARQAAFLHQRVTARGITLGSTLTDCPQVVCFGDSVTAGAESYADGFASWSYQLRGLLSNPVRISTFGFSGATTSEVTTKIAARATAVFSLTTSTPKVVVISTGINDVALSMDSAATIIANLTTAVATARSAGRRT